MIDLRLGRYQDVLRDVACDLCLADQPYSPRTHEGHDDGSTMANGPRRAVGADVDEMTFGSAQARIGRGWTPVLPGMEAVA